MALWIDLYTRCWNDAHMPGFFFRQYDPLVQRYIVYDDGSTDGSIEILKAHPKVEIINKRSTGTSRFCFRWPM